MAKPGTIIDNHPDVFPRNLWTEWVTFRGTTARKIDNSKNRWSQHHDRIDFNSFGINLNTLRVEGYKTVSFYLQLNVRNTYPTASAGIYQRIWLYSSQLNSDVYLVSPRLEYPSTNKDWHDISHFDLNFKDIPINSFMNNEFVIRYSAVAVKDNSKHNINWDNRNLRVQLLFSK